jgi:hypothetical protein
MVSLDCHIIYHNGVIGNERLEFPRGQLRELRKSYCPWSITTALVPTEEPPCFWRHLHILGAEGNGALLGITQLLNSLCPFASPGLSGHVRQALIVFL